MTQLSATDALRHHFGEGRARPFAASPSGLRVGATVERTMTAM